MLRKGLRSCARSARRTRWLPASSVAAARPHSLCFTQPRSFAKLGAGRPQQTRQPLCDGCGVLLQKNDADKPGWYEWRDQRERADHHHGYVPAHVRFAGLLDHPEGEGAAAEEEEVRVKKLEDLTETNTIAQAESAGTDHICQRCCELRRSGRVSSGSKEMIPDDYRQFLSQTLSIPRSAVVMLLVDIFNFHGSFIPNLREIIGTHPVVLVVNKMDLLPKGWGEQRIMRWVLEECEKRGVEPHAVSLVSARSGVGARKALRKIKSFDTFISRDAYVVGTANVGKSTFVNSLQRRGVLFSTRKKPVTASIVPGTTLGLVPFPHPYIQSKTLYDTPGVINYDALLPRLQNDELRAVTPKNRIHPVTYRLEEGKSLLLGGIGRVDHVGGKPFFITSFVSDKVTVHVTRQEKVKHLLLERIGESISPPFTPERVRALGHELLLEGTFEGRGWMESAEDIVFPGLGWVCLTGSGSVDIKVYGPTGLALDVREPLMPWESRGSSRKWLGRGERRFT